jgi:hypothetical protein
MRSKILIENNIKEQVSDINFLGLCISHFNDEDPKIKLPDLTTHVVERFNKTGQTTQTQRQQ